MLKTHSQVASTGSSYLNTQTETLKELTLICRTMFMKCDLTMRENVVARQEVHFRSRRSDFRLFNRAPEQIWRVNVLPFSTDNFSNLRRQAVETVNGYQNLL